MRWEWDWLADHLDEIWTTTQTHMYLSLVPVLYGLLIALPVGLLCARFPKLYPAVFGTVNLLYALPALALFALLLPYYGFSNTTIIIPLTLYTLSVLVPNVVDGVRSVPAVTTQAATAMGYSRLRRMLAIELPISVPVIIAGLRIATVSNISLVSVGALIGNGGLGDYFTFGFQLNFATPIVAAIVLIIALAVAADVLLVFAQRLLTPWAHARPDRPAARARIA